MEVIKTETPVVSGKDVDVEAAAGLKGDDYAVQVRIGPCICRNQATRGVLCKVITRSLLPDVFT